MLRLAHLHLIGPEVHDTLVSVVGGRWAPNTLLRALRSNADAFEQATAWTKHRGLRAVKRRHRADQSQGIDDTIVQWIHGRA
jgi:hypothetical protein